MPALSVSVDGKIIATVCTEGYDLLDFRTGGALIDSDLATLDVFGHARLENDKSLFHIWVCELPVHSQQTVAISFLENASSSHAGKTIDEVFPDDDSPEPTEFKVTDERMAELRAMPKLREKYRFHIESSQGRSFTGESIPDAHSFAFSVFWSSFDAGYARVSLHSSTLDSLESRGPVHHYFQDKLYAGDTVRFVVS